MSARPIGELIAPIMARLQTAMVFQSLLQRCPSVEDRKGFIMAARSHGALDDQEAELLIQANQLETA
jgi:hypothetical protein